jgi:hypothetical protein
MDCSGGPPPFRLYIIFHKFLVEELYKELTDEDIAKYIRFIAVNSRIEKEIPARLAPYILHERRMPWYNPFLQINKFCESSAFYHVWRNGLDQAAPYVGFLHYDMEIRREAILTLERECTAALARGEPVLFPQSCLTARPHIDQVLSLRAWDALLGVYRAMTGSSKGVWDVLDAEIPFYHSFVLHREQFHRLMLHLERAVGHLFELLDQNQRHLPFMLERLHALFLGLERADGRVTRWIPLPGVLHHDHFKDNWRAAAPATARTNAI